MKSHILIRNKKISPIKQFLFLTILCIIVSGCVATTQPSPAQPHVITGDFTYTNDIITTYYVEHMVAMVDLTGFVKRDKSWLMPVEGQILGPLTIDEANKKGSFRLELPLVPAGNYDDVDNNGKKDTGVQIFALAYWPNLSGGPFSEPGDDPSFGWPNYLASVKTDSENGDEIIGGKLLVWAPDDKQLFPTGFGKDGLLFTTDDPVGPLPARYSIINLDFTQFDVSQTPEQTMTLYEPVDAAIKDFSKDTYSDAFDKMFKYVKQNYAFNGVEGKQVYWDGLYSDISANIKQAEQDKDPKAFFLALKDFTLAFNDGHVGMGGGDIGSQVFSEAIRGGYGFAIRELDNGKVIASYVLSRGPAESAGMRVGAEITMFNKESITTAISKVKPFSGPFSTDYSKRYQQAIYLLRASPGTQAEIEFANPGKNNQTVTLEAVAERTSFISSYLYKNYDPNALPVEFKILDTGPGYIKINSNYDDLNLVIRLFERALKTFEANGVPGIIIDMRVNPGGAPLELAGYLYNKEIPLGQLEYYSEKTGKFEPEGAGEKVHPRTMQFKFSKMAVLVDQSCTSACEIESYGFSQVPGMAVFGQYPTGGMEADVLRGQINLPEGISLQVPTGRFTLPNGTIFLEGTGVVPNHKVPIDENSVLSTDDVVLKAAANYITGK